MGRKPRAAKVPEKAQVAASRSVPAGTDEVPPEGEKILSDGLQAQPANGVVLLEKAEPVQKCVDPSSGRTDSLTKQKGKTAKLSDTKKSANGYVRRSGRLRNIVVAARNKDTTPVFEDITGSDSESEDGAPQLEDTDVPKSNLDEMSTEEKVNYLLKHVEALEHSMQALNAKVNREAFVGGSTYSTDDKYTEAHLECEKKIQALTSENHLLAMKLENAVSKLEVYERGNCLFSEMLEKMKDMILLINLAKPTETSGNGEEQGLRDVYPPPDAAGHATSPKRKRRE